MKTVIDVTFQDFNFNEGGVLLYFDLPTTVSINNCTFENGYAGLAFNDVNSAEESVVEINHCSFVDIQYLSEANIFGGFKFNNNELNNTQFTHIVTSALEFNNNKV